MIWEVRSEGEAAQRRAQLKPTGAEAGQKGVCYLFDAYAVTNSEQPCDDVVMGHRDGIEHVTGLPSVLKIRGVCCCVSLPTLWRPIGIKKYLKGFLVTRHKPPPASPKQ